MIVSKYDSESEELMRLLREKQEYFMDEVYAKSKFEDISRKLSPEILKIRGELHEKHGTDFHVYVVLVEGNLRFVGVCKGIELPSIDYLIENNKRLNSAVEKKGRDSVAIAYVEQWLTEDEIWKARVKADF